MEPTSFHKYIKNTFPCRTILTEYLLNAGRSHKAKITSKITTLPGRTKEKRNWDGTCTPGKELEKRRRSTGTEREHLRLMAAGQE